MSLTYLIPNRSRKGGRTPIVEVVPDLVESSWSQSDDSWQEPHSLRGSDWPGNRRVWLRSRRDVKQDSRLLSRALSALMGPLAVYTRKGLSTVVKAVPQSVHANNILMVLLPAEERGCWVA